VLYCNSPKTQEKNMKKVRKNTTFNEHKGCHAKDPPINVKSSEYIA
jgi:hypothetical protein